MHFSLAALLEIIWGHSCRPVKTDEGSSDPASDNTTTHLCERPQRAPPDAWRCPVIPAHPVWTGSGSADQTETEASDDCPQMAEGHPWDTNTSHEKSMHLIFIIIMSSQTPAGCLQSESDPRWSVTGSDAHKQYKWTSLYTCINIYRPSHTALQTELRKAFKRLKPYTANYKYEPYETCQRHDGT